MLDDRQKEVADKLSAEGYSNEQIAALLHFSHKQSYAPEELVKALGEDKEAVDLLDSDVFDYFSGLEEENDEEEDSEDDEEDPEDENA